MNKFYRFIQIIKNSCYLNALIKYKVTASVEHTDTFKYIRETGKIKTIIDIGANQGQFALISRYFFPQAHTFSFEPLSEQAETFRSVFGGDVNVILYNSMIGEEQGTVEIPLSAHDYTPSSILIGEVQACVLTSTKNVSMRKIEITVLNTILNAEEIESPALLKLDVKGFELKTLRGCEMLLHRFNYIYCECSFIEFCSGQALAYEVIDWLQKRNFVLVGIYMHYYDRNGQAVQADFLFRSDMGY